jgi:hypothetical protein
VPVDSLDIISVVDYAEIKYHDFPQLMQIDFNSEQTKIFFYFLFDLMFIIIFYGYNL